MNVFALNTVAIGLDTIDFLSRSISIKGIIGLSDRKATDQISDFVYQKEFSADKNIPFIEVTDYTLKNEDDKKKISELDIDVLVVTGWQRLVPEWLINKCKICVIGIHGSPFGITGGRGRSPQNWALILGSTEFYISIFKIDPGIDSGSVISTRKFPLSPFDTIKTSYYKVSMITAGLITDAILTGKLKETFEQDDEEAFYLPQRKPEDGEIDWNRTSEEIYDFVRALTKPYPGAYTFCDDAKLVVWSGMPFSISEEDGNKFNSEPGTVVKIFNKNDLLIKTLDSFFLIEEYSSERTPAEGEKFKSSNFADQISGIIERHVSKYADMKISPAILNAASVKQKN